MLLKIGIFLVFLRGIAFAVLNNNTEVRLLKHLFDGYSRDVRPIKNVSKPLVITVGLNLQQVIGVDFTHQILTLKVWFQLSWNDEFLIWNPDEFDGIKMITINPSKVWIPEVVLYNTGGMKSVVQERVYDMMVHSNGHIFWSSPSAIASECRIEVSHFPFDSQKCDIEFGSWSEHGGRLDFEPRLPHLSTETFLQNDEWLMYHNKSWKKVTKYACCEFPYPTIMFTVGLQRRAMFYFLNLIVPCGLLTVISMFSFILPPNSGERVSFVITVLLALSVYMMMVTNTMPHSSQTPLASKFFLFVIIQQGLSLVMTCFVIKYHNSDEPLPKWFHFLVNRCLVRLLCMESCGTKRNEPESLSQKDSLFVKRTIFVNNGYDDEKTSQAQEVNEKPENGIKKLDFEARKQSSKVEHDNARLVEEVKVLSDKIRELNAKEKLQDEWLFATHVLDRFFLVTLAVSIAIAFLSVFLAIPDGSILT